MTLDERARAARSALLERAHEVARERPWIVQPVEHRPRRFGMGVVAAVLAGLVVVGLVWIGVVDRDGSAPTGPTGFGISERPPLRDDAIVAALVSSSGDLVVIVRSRAGFEGRHLSVGAGAPVVDVDGVPGPRWMLDGRTIEFVADLDGNDQVVRVDVYTGRSTTQPYRELDVDATDQAGRLDFLIGADWSTVRVVRRDGARWWQFSSIRDDRSGKVLPFGSVIPLAPAPDGVVVSTDGRVAVRSGDGTLADVDTTPFAPDDITAAAYAPGPRLLLGTRHGTIVDGKDHVTTSTGWPVTALAWGDDSDTVVAETSSQGRHGFHLCQLAALECVDIAIERADLVGLVRGSSYTADADRFTGIWPETTSAQAARVDTTTETWRLDPETVAARFATDVLGWSDPIVGTELVSPFTPWSSSFEVAREAAGPTVNISVSQLAGNDGWVVTHAASPALRFAEYGYNGSEVSVAVDPADAERATVIFTVNGKPYTSTATRGEPDFADVTIRVDGGVDMPASALVLLEDDQQRIFAAYSATLGAGADFERVAIG